MSHGDQVRMPLPDGFDRHGLEVATRPIAAIASGNIAAIQFHPEVAHTPQGKEIIRELPDPNLRLRSPNWTPASFIEQAIARDSRSRSAMAGCCSASRAASTRRSRPR